MYIFVYFFIETFDSYFSSKNKSQRFNWTHIFMLFLYKCVYLHNTVMMLQLDAHLSHKLQTNVTNIYSNQS